VTTHLSEASVLVSLGKLNSESNPNDIIRSLFFMVTFNIAQIALSYSELKNIKHVLFTGFYCRGNNFFLQCFTEAFQFFGRKSNSKFVYSMIHDGFLGALGALQMEL
jgi:pantothenate kinase